MPLLDLMKDSPATVNQFTIEQAVAMAGDGNILDGSTCSQELREYLSRVSSEKLFEHVEHCLSSSFNRSGFILQDIVNELGRRLGYEVEHGLYQGKRNSIGFDGVWREPSGSQIVIEVKTSDAYRINLDTLAGYRKGLIRESLISEKSSVLLVVGRQDTGDLEAQIRGSKHAWDIRVISSESLIKLVKIKESADEDIKIMKIRSLLTPFEHTRLDNIIDIMFTAAQDVEPIELDPPDGETDIPPPDTQISTHQRTPQQIISKLRERIVSSLAERDGISLIAHKRAQFWTPDHKVRVACTISKRYDKGYHYWYIYRTQWDKFLEAGDIGYFALGCIDKEVAYVLPRAEISGQLPNLNTTTHPSGISTWHVFLEDDREKGMSLVQGGGERQSIAKFAMRLTDL